MSDITNLSALQLRNELADGSLTATQVLEHFLAVIEEKNPELGAFMFLADPDQLREQARTLDEQREATGAPVGALHGLPTAFKDLVNIAGMPTTYGSKFFEHAAAADADDQIAATAREAGTVLVGKTTVPEFGLPCYSENLISAPARNPLNPKLTAGGSSGGAAAAVASGMLPVAPGTDGGGSIRIPAAATGLVGLKPGRGTVPADDSRNVVNNLAVTGPIARTAVDAALLMDALVDPHATAGPYLQAAQAGAAGPLDPLTINYTTSSPFHPDLEISLSRHAIDALTKAVMLLSRDGHQLAERVYEFIPGYHQKFQTVWTAGAAAAPLPEGAEEQLDVLARHFIDSTRARPAEEIDAAHAELTDWAADTRRQFGESDIVLTPVLAFAPPEIGAFTKLEPQENYEYQCRFTPYTSMVNVMGLPAISVPVLTDDEGLSWSVQAIGRPGTEAQLLGLAARLQVLVQN